MMVVFQEGTGIDRVSEFHFESVDLEVFWGMAD